MPTLEEILITICTTIGSGLLAALVVYYTTSSKKIAEIDTISSKIDEISAQQVTLTTATEQVKEDIKHQAWKKQESALIKRVKIEEYYTLINQLPFYMLEYFNYARYSDYEKPEENFSKASMIAHLYLPDLYDKHQELSKVMKSYYAYMTKICNQRKVGEVDFKSAFNELQKYIDQALEVSTELKNMLANEINLLNNAE